MKQKEMRVDLIPIHEIRIAERIRRDNGSLDDLALDIQEHGLLNPITVMEQADGGYVLIAGLRRLKAMEQTGEADIRATVMSPMEADEILLLEISENEQRKDFTTAERLAFAERIRAVEQEKGKQRRLRRAKKSEGDFEVAKRPPQTGEGNNEAGKVRDIVARKAGFSSTAQMRRAQELADARPDLVEAVDKGEKTIGGAYQQMCKEEQGEKAVSGDPDSVSPAGADKADDFICEERVDVPFYEPYRPGSEPAPGNVRTVKGADHEHLLANPIYSRLYESYNDAVQQVNLARGELRTRCEGYERRIRGYAENIQTMQREIARLREALHA